MGNQEIASLPPRMVMAMISGMFFVYGLGLLQPEEPEKPAEGIEVTLFSV